jgi:hypothetical protein
MEKSKKDEILDKFFSIESWAYRGKKLIEIRKEEKAKETLMRIHKALRELDALMEYNDDLNL